jgi:tRNA U54 and U55 pseudouridine synthase Pus10
MKKFVVCLIVAAVALSLTNSAYAVGAFQKQFVKSYTSETKNKVFFEAVAKAKCNVCHYGKSKKMRNDYGTALSKLLDKSEFKTSLVKADPEGAEKKIVAAFEKVAKMKNGKGLLYGDLIKQLKLPGTAPEE